MKKWLKRVTTTPKILRPLLGKSWADEVGTGVGFAVGGPAGAAAGRGAGKLAHTGDLRQGAMGALEGYTMGTGLEAAGLKGGAMLGTLRPGRGMATGPGGVSGSEAGAKAAAALAKGGGGGSGSVLDDVWSFVKSNPELILGTATAGLNAMQGARDDAMRREGLEMLRARQAAAQPLTNEAHRLLLMGLPQRQRLTGVFEDRSNPFYRELA